MPNSLKPTLLLEAWRSWYLSGKNAVLRVVTWSANQRDPLVLPSIHARANLRDNSNMLTKAFRGLGPSMLSEYRPGVTRTSWTMLSGHVAR